MCFSAEVSLMTFIIGTVGSFFVYNIGTPFDHIVGLYLGFTSLIQGIEFLICQMIPAETTNMID